MSATDFFFRDLRGEEELPALLLLIDNVNTANPVAETENRYNKTVVVTIAFFRATGMIVVERFDW